MLWESYRIQSKFKSSIVCSEWHKELPFLCIATSNGVVSVYNEEGLRIDDVNLSRSFQATCLGWHPTQNILVTGWKDGLITLYDGAASNQKDVIQQNNTQHGSVQITNIFWSSDVSSNRFITVDLSYYVVFWKLDDRNRLTCLCKLKSQELVRHVVFITSRASIVSDSTTTNSTKTNNNNVLEQGLDHQIVFLAGDSGTIFVANENGQMKKFISLNSPLATLAFNREKSQLVALTTNSYLSTYKINDDLSFEKVQKAKINASQGNTNQLKALWIGSGMLVTSSNEKFLRVWNLETDENFVLDTEKIKDNFVDFAFNPKRRTITAITSSYAIFFWSYSGISSQGDLQKGYDGWDYIGDYQGLCSQAATQNLHSLKISWGPGEEFVFVVWEEEAFVLQETLLKLKLKKNTAVLQVGNDALKIEKFDKRNSTSQHQIVPIKCGLKVKQLDVVDDHHLAVSNGRVVEVWEMKQGVTRIQTTIDVQTSQLALHSEGLFACVKHSNKIEIYNFNGTKKQTISIPEQEGTISFVDIQNDFIVIATKNNQIQLWKIIGREAKQISGLKQIFKASSKKAIRFIKVNSNGTKISIQSDIIHDRLLHEPCSELLIFDLDQDKIDTYDFENRYPITHFWDETDPRLLAVELSNPQSVTAVDTLRETEKFSKTICILFASVDHGIIPHDTFAMDRQYSGLLALAIPFLYFLNRSHMEDETKVLETMSVCQFTLRDFQGIEQVENETRDALINFSYFLAIGNTDEAYKSIKAIKNPNVWHNMAQVCVKTKKLEIAEICISNMQDARAAKALREVKNEPEIEARIAMLAIQLGLYEEAEKLYISCKRFDLLNKMYRQMGHWDKALEVAEKFDRMHLKSTHFDYAKHLESLGDTRGAINHYELAETNSSEVPRMLYCSNQVDLLEKYVRISENNVCMNWWAQYSEGISNYEAAFEFYKKSNDILSLVRLLCFVGKLKEASDLITESGNKAAAFQLAKQLEMNKQIEPAIEFYTFANSYKHAIRLAKEYNIEQQVMQLAMQAPPHIMVDAATYFEDRGQRDKAVLLYQKAGHLHKAIDLCFRAQLFDALGDIADAMEEIQDNQNNLDTEVFKKCAEFFVEYGKFDKAVQMYTRAGMFHNSLDICLEYNIKLTEEVAERMVPSNTDASANVNSTTLQQKELLLKIADVATQQGSHQLAAKKYVQANEKEKAMKALIKSGDTEKIIFFAVISRQRELYILAANYLQNLEWHNDPEIMKSIISFYTKAKAFEQLSKFYQACSQVEIDEYRNYDKALDALKEALKNLTKVVANGMSSEEKQKMILLKNKIYMVDKFIAIRNLFSSNSDSNQALQTCNQFIQEIVNTNDSPVRLGDVLALVVEFYYSQGKKREAFEMIQKMKLQQLDVQKFINFQVLESVCREVGVPVASMLKTNHSKHYDDDDDDILHPTTATTNHFTQEEEVVEEEEDL